MTKLRDLHHRMMADANYRRDFDALEAEFSLAETLIMARLAAGLTQGELAARMQTTQSAIARLEGGQSLPSARTLHRLAQATGTRLKIVFEPADAAS